MATERYLATIRAQSNMQPKLEENHLKILHMKEPVGDWREWTILTYDQNVLGDLLTRENKLLQKRIDEYEMKLKILTSAPPLPPTYTPRSQNVDLEIATSWKENEP
ncbi:hypothetical protein EUGRSUZ_C03159 [Eucalyptus grandis]|uniref:Uncharacterized protein n=3 Tax=Eucalyptus TaxID=3932 RepID=A0A059CTK0_EUCGR|nr:hypothetical protein EUGRSUZ_C03159 [Eucalyptus grandis]